MAVGVHPRRRRYRRRLHQKDQRANERRYLPGGAREVFLGAAVGNYRRLRCCVAQFPMGGRSPEEGASVAAVDGCSASLDCT